VWQYEEADYPTGPGIPRSSIRYTRFRVTRCSVACRLNLEARFFFLPPLRRKFSSLSIIEKNAKCERTYIYIGTFELTKTFVRSVHFIDSPPNILKKKK